MTMIFNRPLVFRNKTFRSIHDIAKYFKPDSCLMQEYFEFISQKIDAGNITSESEFLNQIKPDGAWFFCSGVFYKNATHFLLSHELPLKLGKYVDNLVSTDVIDTEKSLLMLVQNFKSSVINLKIEKKKKTDPILVFGNSFDTLPSLMNFLPFLSQDDFEEIEVTQDVIERKVDDYLEASPLKLGCCFIVSLEEMMQYTSLKKWNCILKLRAIFCGKTPENAFFGLLDDSSPVIVNGEMFRHIDDALKSYAIHWYKAMDFMLSVDVITPNVLDDLFSNESLVGKSLSQMVTFSGRTMPLVDLMGTIDGKSSIFISRMKEVEPLYRTMTLQQIIEKHLLNSGESLVGQ